MRIVALVHAYLPYHLAGSEFMLHALLRAARERGHTVDVVVTEQPTGPDRYEHDGVTVHRAGRTHLTSLDELRPDILVTHHGEADHAHRYGRARHIPVVQVLNDTFAHNLKSASRCKDLVVFNTRWVRDEFERQHWTRPASVIVHPPIDADRHRTTPGTKVTLVNLSPNKGAGVFYALARQFPQLEFLGVLGAYGQQTIEDLPNVTIHPTTTDPREFWSQTRVLLMPSTYESYGMVALEAAVSGIPTIAAPTPGLQEALGAAATFVDRLFLSGWVAALNALQPAAAWSAAADAARGHVDSLDSAAELAAWVDAAERLLA